MLRVQSHHPHHTHTHKATRGKSVCGWAGKICRWARRISKSQRRHGKRIVNEQQECRKIAKYKKYNKYALPEVVCTMSKLQIVRRQWMGISGVTRTPNKHQLLSLSKKMYDVVRVWRWWRCYGMKSPSILSEQEKIPHFWWVIAQLWWCYVCVSVCDAHRYGWIPSEVYFLLKRSTKIQNPILKKKKKKETALGIGGRKIRVSNEFLINVLCSVPQIL